jgi:hypothetical protein
MRNIWVFLLFAVLGLGLHAPNASALGFVDVQYNVVADITFLQGAGPVATGVTGTMTIRYNNGTGVTGGTTIASGNARLMSLNVSGPMLVYVPGILMLTGNSTVAMGTAAAIGSWGSNIPNTGTGTAPVGGLRLLGLNGAFAGLGNCTNLGTAPACTGNGMPVGSNPNVLGAAFANRGLTGYGNFNPTGPPSPLSFLTVSATSPLSFATMNMATNFLGAPLELGNIIGTETSRTAVPEPNTALLLAGGIIGLGWFGSSRKRNGKNA